VASFGTPRPSLLLTGADPLERPDLCDLVRYATRQELPVTISLSGTPLLTAARLQGLKDAGASAITLALDGSTPELQDSLQCMAGAFAQTVAGARAAHAMGLPPTIVSTVTRANLLDLPNLLALVRDLGVTTWHVSFPNPNDWAHTEDAIDPPDYEAALNLLYDMRRFIRVSTNASRHFRRVTLQRMVLEAWNLPAEHYMRLNATYLRLKARLHAVTWERGRPPPAGYVQTHHPPATCLAVVFLSLTRGTSFLMATDGVGLGTFVRLRWLTSTPRAPCSGRPPSGRSCPLVVAAASFGGCAAPGKPGSTY